MKKRDFIPGTIARSIGNGVFFQPIKSWHSGTYAGERLFKMPGTDDGSGCARKRDGEYGLVTSVPLTVTHRIYWHERNTEKWVSAFLSYPDAMGCSGEQYFWETYGISDDVERYFGDGAEAEMEKAILEHFAKAEHDAAA